MKYNRFMSLMLLGVMLLGNAQAKIPVRQKTRLIDNWTFLRQDISSIWEAVRPVRPGQPEASPIWQKVTVPHCFNAEDAVDPDVNYYQGPGWYKTLLSIQNPYRNGRVMLEFEGAGQKTDVYVYTKKVGSHVGGYDSWNVDITDAVNDFLKSEAASRFKGSVPLSIRCDNTRDAEMIPSNISDFNVYGGLYRYLNLVYLPEVTMNQLHIEPMLDSNLKEASVKVTGSFYNPSDVRKADVHVCIKSPDGKTVADKILNSVTPLGDLVLLDIKLDKPQLWDVDAPRLYTCEVTVESDGQKVTSVENFGIRSFSFADKGPFYLNNRRLLLQGTHRHEDHAGVGAAMTEEQMRQEMQLMKDMGVNFIRLGHYQQSEIILNLCDELGILVWEEIPWCRGGVGGKAYRSQAKRMLSNMISQHYNHPAVIVWGLGNENDWPNEFERFEQSDIRAFMSELNTLAHRLDASRKTSIRRCDFCNDIVDVYSPSIWAGWYKGKYTDYMKLSREGMEKVNHFLHVEWGGDSHVGRYVEDLNPTKNDWSESYIVKLFDWHLKEQEKMPWLTGTAFWTFKDFSTPIRPENPIPYVNQKGVVGRDLVKKESYYVFQSYWTKTPMVHIIGHTQPIRWGNPDERKEVLVYSNCKEVELFVNGVSQGKKKRNSQDFPAAGLRWSVPFNAGNNELKAVATANGKQQVEDTVSFEYQTAKWGAESVLAVSTEPIDAETVLVKVRVEDSKGVPCLDSKRVVRFELSGDGALIKNLGTVNGSSKVEVSNGMASIRMKKQAGRSVVAVKSVGLKTQFVTIE